MEWILFSKATHKEATLNEMVSAAKQIDPMENSISTESYDSDSSMTILIRLAVWRGNGEGTPHTTGLTSKQEKEFAKLFYIREVLDFETAKKGLRIGTILNHSDARPNSDGTLARFKVTSVKTWKRDPDRIEIHVKRGMREFYVWDEAMFDFAVITIER